MKLRLKTNLQSGNPTIGSWLTLGNADIAEVMARSGFDWLTVDLEHSHISLSQAGDLIRTIDLMGLEALVRLTSNNPDQIKRVMDAGAHGIIVPNVKCAQDVEIAFEATRYQPLGKRGVGLGRAQHYGAAFGKYFDWQSNGAVLIVQIEDIEAVENLSEILSQPGVDGFMVGPYDLSCSMGMPGKFGHESFLKIMEEIIEAGQSYNVPAGIHIVEPDLVELALRVKQGFKFLVYSVDSRMVDNACRTANKFFSDLVS